MLAVVFAITSVVIMSQADLGAPAVDGGVGGVGGFLLTVGTTFGYVAGWAPYAADFSRYLPSTVSPVRTGLFAAAGLFLACAILAIVGAASATIVTAATDNPTDAFTSSLPAWLAEATLLAIAIGAIAANAINVYSAGMAFVTTGVRLPAHTARAVATVFFGLAGFLVAWWALGDAATSYKGFLFLIAYWVGPWLGVVFADQFLRRGQRVDGLLYDHNYSNRPGLVSFLIGLVASFVLFCNQELFVGFVVRALPELGDIGFFVGFVLAAGCYLVLCRNKIAAEKVPV